MKVRSKAPTIKVRGETSGPKERASAGRSFSRSSGTPLGTLYIIPTPIGNLEDLTFRAARVLGEVDVVLAEDTRKARKVLSHLGLKTKVRRYDLVTEAKRTEDVTRLLRSGQNIGLTTSAGTPAISDPGYLLVRAVRAEGLSVVALPGASAAVTALSGAGLASEQFLFLGFLPRRAGERTRELQKAAIEDRTTVIYESPRRIRKTLAEVKEHFPARRIAVCRELTKLFETYYVGSVDEVLAQMADVPKGEHVLIVEKALVHCKGMAGTAGPDAEHFATQNIQALTSKEMSRELVQRFGLTKNSAYELVLKVKRGLLR